MTVSTSILGDTPWLEEECEEIKSHECPAGWVNGFAPPLVDFYRSRLWHLTQEMLTLNNVKATTTDFSLQQ